MMLDALAAILQALLFAGLLSCSGVVFAEASLGGSPEVSRFALQVMRRGALLTIVAALTGALILIFRLSGRFDQVTLSAVFLSISGAALSLQISGALLLLAAITEDPFARSMRLVNGLLVTLSFAFHGHAASAGTGAAILAVAHITAAAWWIGSLWLLHRACSLDGLPELASLVLRFSALAVRVIGGLLMAGMVLTLLLISSAATPLTSPYLKLLALKVGLVAVTLGAAAYNKYRLTPRLARHDIAAVAALRSMIRNELILIAAIITTTAFLTTYTTPFTEITF